MKDLNKANDSLKLNMFARITKMKKSILFCLVFLSQCNTTDEGGLTPPLYKTWTRTSSIDVTGIDNNTGMITVIDTLVDSVQIDITSGKAEFKSSLTYKKQTQTNFDTTLTATFENYSDTLQFKFTNQIIKVRYELKPGYGTMRIWQALTDTLRLNSMEISLSGTYY